MNSSKASCALPNGVFVNSTFSPTYQECGQCLYYVARSNQTCVSSCNYQNTTTGFTTVCETQGNATNCPYYVLSSGSVYNCRTNCTGYLTQGSECVTSCSGSTPVMDLSAINCVSTCTPADYVLNSSKP